MTAREQGGLDPEASVTRDVVVTREAQVTVLVRFPFLLLDVIWSPRRVYVEEKG